MRAGWQCHCSAGICGDTGGPEHLLAGERVLADGKAHPVCAATWPDSANLCSRSVFSLPVC